MTPAGYRWFDLGRFRILAMPLATNEWMTTHRIYLGDKLVGKQLSVPNIDQCEDRLRESKAVVAYEPSKFYNLSVARRGRPRKIYRDTLEAA